MWELNVLKVERHIYRIFVALCIMILKYRDSIVLFNTLYWFLLLQNIIESIIPFMNGWICVQSGKVVINNSDKVVQLITLKAFPGLQIGPDVAVMVFGIRAGWWKFLKFPNRMCIEWVSEKWYTKKTNWWNWIFDFLWMKWYSVAELSVLQWAMFS